MPKIAPEAPKRISRRLPIVSTQVVATSTPRMFAAAMQPVATRLTCPDPMPRLSRVSGRSVLIIASPGRPAIKPRTILAATATNGNFPLRMLAFTFVVVSPAVMSSIPRGSRRPDSIRFERLDASQTGLSRAIPKTKRDSMSNPGITPRMRGTRNDANDTRVIEATDTPAEKKSDQLPRRVPLDHDGADSMTHRGFATAHIPAPAPATICEASSVVGPEASPEHSMPRTIEISPMAEIGTRPITSAKYPATRELMVRPRRVPVDTRPTSLAVSDHSSLRNSTFSELST
mmetsp:Transcript_7379/g.9140  ORF Transcript_7379/g.9140 Transcript_7379/m.9140 type:complete len:288 (+) Transcript_7379:1202-2065(+)